MLSNVLVVNSRGLQVDLTLNDTSEGFVVKGIDGLEPVKASVVSTAYATMDGVRFQNARRDPRNIVLRIGFQPDYVVYDVADIRSRLYNVLMPKSHVTLTFEDSEGGDKYIEGIVESFEAPYFTSEPGADISILCFDPDFLALEESEFIGGPSTGDPTREETLVPYSGTVETGFVLTYDVLTNPTPGFTVDLRQGDGLTRSLVFNANLTGGQVSINTQPGQKDASLIENGLISSVLYGISPQSEWLELAPGENHIKVNNSVGAQFDWTLRYRERFGGL